MSSETYSLEAHLGFIQDVIKRMANNSFLIRGWSVTVSGAIVALGVSAENPCIGYLALTPAIVFWGMDAYYLRQERLFRALYDAVRNQGQDDVPTIDAYSLNTSTVAKSIASLCRVAWSQTVWPIPIVTMLVSAGVSTFMLLSSWRII